MAFAIKKSAPVHFPKGKPAKKADYLAFLHTLPCVVTGRSPVQAAHVSFKAPQFGAYGRGKGHKVSDRWALPVCADAHEDQHRHNEEQWWANLRINPHLLALSFSACGANTATTHTRLLSLSSTRIWQRVERSERQGNDDGNHRCNG